MEEIYKRHMGNLSKLTVKSLMKVIQMLTLRCKIKARKYLAVAKTDLNNEWVRRSIRL